jgi:hypothetical protein
MVEEDAHGSREAEREKYEESRDKITLQRLTHTDPPPSTSPIKL